MRENTNCRHGDTGSNMQYIASFSVSHEGYSGIETVCFYSCPICGQIFEQTHYYDPFDDSSSNGNLKESMMKMDEIEYLETLNEIILPFGVHLGDRRAFQILTRKGSKAFHS